MILEIEDEDAPKLVKILREAVNEAEEETYLSPLARWTSQGVDWPATHATVERFKGYVRQLVEPK